jgi:hypothetical protein
MKYVRLVADKSGKTYFEDATLQLDEADYRPPAPMVYVSHAFQTDGVQFIRLPSGWTADAIHVPKKQFMLCLRGQLEIVASGGDKRSFGPGDCILMEDVEGDGHKSSAKGGEFVAAVVPVD